MNFAGLVERLVPIFAELLATLASQDPLRMSFAGIAEKTVLDIAETLRAEGMSQEAVAASLGLTITGFQSKIKRLRAAHKSPTSPADSQTLLERVYGYIVESEDGTAVYADLDRHFKGVKRDTLAGILHHLVQFGILSVSGRREAREYRAIRGARVRQATSADAQMVLYRSGPMTIGELALALTVSPEAAQEFVDELCRSGNARHATSPDDEARYTADTYHIPVSSPEGFESAIWDHVNAVVQALSKKVRMGRHRAEPDDRIGGTTFSFAVPVDHPLSDEIGAFLSETRVRMEDWRERAAALPQSDENWEQITIYAGQMVQDIEPE